MWFDCEQPFLSGERCVTSRKTAAKETIVYRVELENGGVLATEHYVRVALATSDVQSILDIPATNEIHMEDRNHGLA